MKKTMTILLSLIMALCLTACGNSAGQPEGSDMQTDSDSADDTDGTGTDDSAEAGDTVNAGQPETQPEEAGASGTQENKILVVYFSATNTTEGVAEHIANGLNADIYEIVPEEPYTEADLDYNDDDSRSTVEMSDADARPAISGSVENMEQYDIVFIGYPRMMVS